MTREEMIDLAVHNVIWEGLACRSMTRTYFEQWQNHNSLGEWARLFGKEVQAEFRRIETATTRAFARCLKCGMIHERGLTCSVF